MSLSIGGSLRWSGLVLPVVLVLSALPVGLAQDYSQAPQLAQEMAAGELPPLEERLPSNPLIVDFIEVGKYGGTIAAGVDGDNFAGTNWYGAGSKIATYLYEPLVSTVNPDRLELAPNLAESWSVSDDGTTYSFKLREGIKWSDGTPFTSADVEFTFDHLIKDSNIQKPQGDAFAKVGGEFGDIIVEDDLNFRFEFPAPNPLFLELIAKNESFIIMPKHELSQDHPAFNSNATYEDFTQARSYGVDTPHATLSGWKFDSGNDSTQTWVRNPYYWKVDSAGNQLPYIDTLIFRNFGNRQALGLSIVAGDTQVIIDGATADTLPTVISEADSRPYNVIISPLGFAYSGPHFNLDAPNPNLQKLFREKDFIEAMRFGVNRDAVQAAMPVVTVVSGITPPVGTPYYDAERFAKWSYSYGPERANTLLDGLGLVDSDGDGIRNYPDGYPSAGENISMEILSRSGHPTRVTLYENLAKQYTENLSLDVTLDAEPDNIYVERRDAGDFDVWGYWSILDYVMDEPLLRPWSFAGTGAPGDTGQNVCPWFQLNSCNDDPVPWMRETRALLEQASGTVDADERRELVFQVLENFAENAPVDQVYIEKLWRGLPDEELIGNVPWYMWPDEFNAGHGQQAQIMIDLEYWYWK